ALNNITLWIFTNRITSGTRVWLVSDQNSPTADFDFEGQWLAAHSLNSECKIFTQGLNAVSICSYAIRQ
ncbi:MAG: hypothetical protein Q7U31_05330, partial [Anaerolineaceae bacterium]|nr:hypothetical protein [Anaerolineaceae bacterium]